MLATSCKHADIIFLHDAFAEGDFLLYMIICWGFMQDSQAFVVPTPPFGAKFYIMRRWWYRASRSLVLQVTKLLAWALGGTNLETWTWWTSIPYAHSLRSTPVWSAEVAVLLKTNNTEIFETENQQNNGNLLNEVRLTVTVAICHAEFEFMLNA